MKFFYSCKFTCRLPSLYCASTPFPYCPVAAALPGADAAARGLVAGSLVRVFNDRGAFVAGLVIADSVMAGVVQIPTGGTYDPYDHPELGEMCLHGNPNAVTRDVGTSSLAQGPSSSTTMVRVQALTHQVPDVRSFIAPIAD